MKVELEGWKNSEECLGLEEDLQTSMLLKILKIGPRSAMSLND